MVLIILIEVEKVEPVGHVDIATLRAHSLPVGLDCNRLLDGLATLVHVPFDLVVLVLATRGISLQSYPRGADYLQAAHHAGPSEHGVMHRVGLDIAAAAHELHLDHNQIVDVLKVVPEVRLGQARIAAPDDEVASGSCTDLAGHVSSQDELTVVPADVHLLSVSD